MNEITKQELNRKFDLWLEQAMKENDLKNAKWEELFKKASFPFFASPNRTQIQSRIAVMIASTLLTNKLYETLHAPGFTTTE